jgi:transposase
MTKSATEADSFRRIEVISGVGRRRRWSEERKAAIVAESFEEGAVVSEVARRHNVATSQLFTWRKAAREQASAESEVQTAFVPVAVSHAQPAPVRMNHGPSMIEVEIEGAKIRIPPDASPKTIEAVIEGLSEAAVIFGAVPPRIYIATRPIDFRKGMTGSRLRCSKSLGSIPSAVRLSYLGQSGRTGSRF